MRVPVHSFRPARLCHVVPTKRNSAIVSAGARKVKMLKRALKSLREHASSKYRAPKTGLHDASRSCTRYRGAVSRGKASVIWWDSHTCVGFSIAPKWMIFGGHGQARSGYIGSETSRSRQLTFCCRSAAFGTGARRADGGRNDRKLGWLGASCGSLDLRGEITMIFCQTCAQ